MIGSPSNGLIVTSGNVGEEALARGGWIIGHFVDDRTDPRRSTQVEVKWGIHGAGDGEDEWSVNDQATSLSILISGHDRISFPDQDIDLARQGDYALWSAGVPHRWRALADSVVLTVRWPSIPDDNRHAVSGDFARFASQSVNGRLVMAFAPEAVEDSPAKEI